jgi:MoxR-like ATPase
VLGGKALAVLAGQPTVSAEHIRRIAPFVLRHRVLPNFNAAGEGVTAQDIVKRIVGDTAEPMYG